MSRVPKLFDDTDEDDHVRSRLVAVYSDDTQAPGQPGDLIATYAYDGVNRRVTKTLADGTSTEYYYNHQWQLLEERSLDVQQAVVAVDQYVWDQSYIAIRRWKTELATSESCKSAPGRWQGD